MRALDRHPPPAPPAPSPSSGPSRRALSAAQVHTSNLFPATPNAAYYTVTFTGNDTDVVNYHPKITLTDPLGEFVMDITTDCTTLIATCNTGGDTGTSDGVTTWEMKYTAGDPNSKAPDGTTSNFDPIPLPGTGGTVYIKVYRKVALTKCSNAYTLNVKE